MLYIDVFDEFQAEKQSRAPPRHEWHAAAAVESTDQGRTTTVVWAPWWRKGEKGTEQVLRSIAVPHAK